MISFTFRDIAGSSQFEEDRDASTLWAKSQHDRNQHHIGEISKSRDFFKRKPQATYIDEPGFLAEVLQMRQLAKVSTTASPAASTTGQWPLGVFGKFFG